MGALIKKDFLMIGTELKYSIFIFFIGYTLLAICSPDISITNTSGFIAMCIIFGLFTTEEKAKFERQILCLPMSRENMVCSRYVINLIILGFAEIISSLTLILKGSSPEKTIKYAVLIAIFEIICTSLSMPILFALNSQKKTIFAYLCIGIGAGFHQTCLYIFDDKNIKIFHKNIPGSILMILITFAVYAVSCVISTALYKKREFN